MLTSKSGTKYKIEYCYKNKSNAYYFDYFTKLKYDPSFKGESPFIDWLYKPTTNKLDIFEDTKLIVSS